MEDYCFVDTVSTNADLGRVLFQVDYFYTCADGTGGDEHPVFVLIDECRIPEEYPYAGHVLKYSLYCIKICHDCTCDPVSCPDTYSHSKHLYTYQIRHPGHFFVDVFFKGRKIASFEFYFKELPGDVVPDFLSTEILSFDSTSVPPSGVFDVDEEMIFRVAADWNGGQSDPDYCIDLIIKATGSPDSLLTGLPLIDEGPPAIYIGNIEGGSLRGLFPDPESHFAINRTEELKVYPKKTICDDDQHNGPTAAVKLGYYRLRIDTLSFMNSLNLCHETPTGWQPTEPIELPHWDRFSKNEPACYVKNSRPELDIIIKANHNPLHKLPFRLCAITKTNFNVFYINWKNDTLEYDYREEIHGLAAIGTTADSIGFDSLKYYWAFVIAQLAEPRWAGKATGPHILYRTYAQPIQSHPAVYPINVEACLEKVCREYARDENEVETILQLTSTGISSENYTYNPSIGYYDDPIELFRQRIGLCADYAMYMTAIMHSIGVPVNCRTILSGNETIINTRLDYWWNLYYYYNYPPNDSFWCALWTNSNVGGTLPDGAYHFWYHMVTRYLDPSGTSFIYDPVWNINGNWDDWIGSEFRYYYNVGCVSSEPPINPPGYYDWGTSEMPIIGPTPNWGNFDRRFHRDCRHPDN